MRPIGRRAACPGHRVLPAQGLRRGLGIGQEGLCARKSTGALSSAPAGAADRSAASEGLVRGETWRQYGHGASRLHLVDPLPHLRVQPNPDSPSSAETPVALRQAFDLDHIATRHIPGAALPFHARRKLRAAMLLTPRTLAPRVPTGALHLEEAAFHQRRPLQQHPVGLPPLPSQLPNPLPNPTDPG